MKPYTRNAKIVIEKGIPIPPKQDATMSAYTKALMTMKSGDSFLVQTTQQRQSIMRSACHRRIKVTTRKENGTGYRIWRTE